MIDHDYYLLSDVAKILRCRPSKIVYLLATRQVPEPALRIGNRRVFTTLDLFRLSEKLQIDLAQELKDKENLRRLHDR